MEIKAIAGLIPIHLHLQKLSGRNQLQLATFFHNHIIKVLFKRSHVPQSHQYHLFLEFMMPKQKLNIKSCIVDANNYLNGVFLSFSSLNRELYLEQRLINIFF